MPYVYHSVVLILGMALALDQKDIVFSRMDLAIALTAMCDCAHTALSSIDERLGDPDGTIIFRNHRAEWRMALDGVFEFIKA